MKMLLQENLLVEFVMHVLEIVVEQFVLLLICVFNHPTWKLSDAQNTQVQIDKYTNLNTQIYKFNHPT